MRVMRHPCVAVLAVLITFASCGGRGDGLRELDKVIADQKYYRDSLERSMNMLREELDKTSSDSVKWEYARRLFSGYYHYSQDSSSRYQRLMERYASDDSQRFLAKIQKVRIFLIRNEDDMAASVFNSLDTARVVADPELLNDYIQCEAVLCSDMLSSDISEEEKDVYRQRLRSSRTRSLAIDSTSFYARRMKAQLCRDSGDTLAAMAILEELYNGSDNPHEKASVAYNLARIHGSQGDDEARFDWLVRSAVHDFKNAERAYMSLAKSEGLDAVMKALRSPAAMYNEYENYYQIFDETFLGIYPDFVEKVNALLSEDARFDLHGEKTLPTELRILAAIRIGITESGKIAKFLKCSPNTVYTYRAKLKRSAVCPKENFEAEIAKI